jgi:prolyl oligopeptidase
MKKIPAYLFLIAISSAILASSCKNGGKNEEKMAYPVAKKVDSAFDYNGTKVADPYNWLEADGSADVKNWIEAENKLTFGYIDSIPYKQNIRKRLEEIWNYPKYSAPSKKGDYYFFSKNDGLQNQSVVYRQKGLDGEPEVFINPNELSTDGTVALGGLSFSNDNKYVAISTSAAGSDWQTVEVWDVATKKSTGKDKLEWVKFSSPSWRGDGFYYTRYPEPKKGSEYSQASINASICYHKLGTPQSEDKVIYTDPENPYRYYGASVTDDERFLIIYISAGTSGTGILCQDLKDPNGKLQTLFEGFDNNYGVVDNIGDKLLVHTDKGAPKYRLVLVDPKNPATENWKEVIPQSDDLLEGVGTAGGKLFASFLHKAATKMVQYTYEGVKERDIDMPAIGTAGGFSGKKEDKEVFYTFTSFVYPPTIYRYNIETGASEVYKKSEVKFNFDEYETKQITYKSKDGTEIPMFIVHKKGIKLDGNNPCYLYGYGGFNISLSPSFSISRMVLLEKGFVFAMPSLRGGGEFGEDWHKAGMLEKKQNVFDDFIGAAEHLIKEKYTNSSKLAIAGGSNGGLLVGACMTQRPDLYKVCIPVVGVLDMLRFHRSTAGWGWTVEYGNADSAKDFDFLYKYSPLHNIKDGTTYPATLIMTGDHDDRVVPWHSFKFAARLQEAQKGANPILIRVETNAGHGAGKPTSKQIDETSDQYAFIFKNMGLTY